MPKYAIISDIHGNQYAMKKVLDYIRKNDISKIFICGDMVGYYYGIVEILDMLDGWDWTGISGNHEGMLKDWLEGKNREKIKQKYGSSIEKAASELSNDTIEMLINLPCKCELNIDGKNILLCHGSPWDRDFYIYPDANVEIVDKLFEFNADIILMGHTHYQKIWQRGGSFAINVGSVGQPRDKRTGACFAIWDSETNICELKRVDYDNKKLILECEKYNPELPYLATKFLK